MNFRNILIFIFCIFIGSSLIVLAKEAPTRHLFMSPRVVDDLKVNIEGELKEIERLTAESEEYAQRIKELLDTQKDKAEKDQEIQEKLLADLKLYSQAGGFVDVEGPGVEVTLDDATRPLEPWEVPNDLLIHDLDLLTVVNELKIAGAEVISVNGQRVMDMSSITCSGYTVRINGRSYSKPFVIRAIGDGSRMSAALIGPGGYGTLLKDWGLGFKVVISDNIKIAAYKEGIN